MPISTKMIAAGLALPIALGMAAPAQADPRDRYNHGYSQDYRGDRGYDRGYDRGNDRGYRNGYSYPRIERRIDMLARNIDIAMRKGELNGRSAREMRQRLNSVERTYAGITRHGLSQRDVYHINDQINEANEALSDARARHTWRGHHRDHRRDDRRDYRRGRY